MVKPKSGLLLSHPTGNQNLRNVLLSLSEHDLLAEFWTALRIRPDARWCRILPSSLRSQLLRRSYSEAPDHQIKSHGIRELVRLCARSTPADRFLSGGESLCSIVSVYRSLDRRVARRLSEIDVEAVYAYEGGARHTFERAKKGGITTLYDLPSGYWHWEMAQMAEEASRNAEFASIAPKIKDSSRHLAEKDEELAQADVVIVASNHVRRTLRGVVPDAKIRVIPYGTTSPLQNNKRVFNKKGRLRVLFAGSLNQRKGIGYLLRAIDSLQDLVEFTMIGQRFAPNATVDTACQRWIWHPSLTHARVLETMMESDVLVLPSLSEGFGLVVTEALACGVPVIVTSSVGASDVIIDGREGYIVEPASAEAIAERLLVLNKDRDLLAAMSEQAHRTALSLDWETYRHSIATAIRATLC